MTESIRQAAAVIPAGATRRVAFDRPVVFRAAAGALAAGFVLALLLATLEARAFDRLPGYPAVLLVTLAALVVPGLFLAEALLPRNEGDLIERSVLGLALGTAIAAPSGLLALWLNLSLDTFLRLHIALASIAAGGSILFAPAGRLSWPLRSLRGWNLSAFLLFALLVVAAAGILTSPAWAGERPARNFDDWRYMTYVNSYLQRDVIDPLEPVGLGEVAYPRMAINVWVVLQAGIARAAGVSAEDVVMDDLTPLLAVFALAATYALARGLFRSRHIALLAVAVQLGFALTDLAHDEGTGLNLLLRTSEDKMVGTYILFPLGLLLVARFLSAPGIRRFATFGLISLALFAVHPQPLLFLAIALATLAALRAATARSTKPLLWAGLLAVPLGVFALGEYGAWHLYNTAWPALFRPHLVWRESFKIVHLPGGMIMGNYHLILHPLMIAALALAPVAWLRSRRALPNQLLLATTLGWLPWFFVPPLTTLAAKLASAELTARLPLMAPVAVVLAYLVHHGLRSLSRRWRAWRPARLVAGTIAPAVAVVLVLGVALVVQELFYRPDGGNYYTWTSSTTVVPGTERSIFIGGKDRLLSREWRTSPEERELFAYLRSHLPEGARVLAPNEISLRMPGTLWEVKPVFSEAIVGLWNQPAALRLYTSQLAGPELQQALEQARAEYVVVREVSDANAALRELPVAEAMAEVGPFQVYAIR